MLVGDSRTAWERLAGGGGVQGGDDTDHEGQLRLVWHVGDLYRHAIHLVHAASATTRGRELWVALLDSLVPLASSLQLDDDKWRMCWLAALASGDWRPGGRRTAPRARAAGAERQELG